MNDERLIERIDYQLSQTPESDEFSEAREKLSVMRRDAEQRVAGKQPSAS